jgi:hypothetical protein
MNRLWFEQGNMLRERDGRISVKIYDFDRQYVDSAVVPSVSYPLNSNTYELFHQNNCAPLTNPQAIEAFNAVKYRIGQCYDNTERLLQEFAARNLQLTPYGGWLFIVDSGHPVYHSFAVYEENGQKSVIDLADDYTGIVRTVAQEMEGKPIEEARQIYVDYTQNAMRLSNSERCSVVGVPSDAYLYVAAPCTPQQAIKIRDQLLWQYPDHPCFLDITRSEDGLTDTQRAMKKKGLI